ncbi:hypothetical protein FHG87_010675 [Trinorchestia longiramus]|nr:hypothetical protein FHG87_010675 [Trinorchestia longiramus]
MVGCRVLLPDAGVTSNDFRDPGKNVRLENIDINVCVDHQTLGDHARRHDIDLASQSQSLSISPSEEDEKKDTPNSVIEEMCAKWGELQAFVEKASPDNVVGNRTLNLFNDNIVWHYCKILQ